MTLEVTGKLVQKYPTIQITENFRKREFILELSEEINGNTYTNYAKMQLVQNKCDIIDRFNIGDLVKVSFNIKGTKFMQDGVERYITNLDAWRIEPWGDLDQRPRQPFNTPPADPVDDLPF